MSDIVSHLTEDTFTGAVEHGLAVVAFRAGRCGPCRAMARQFEKAAAPRPHDRLAASPSAVSTEGAAA